MGEGSVIDLLTDEGEMTGPRPYGYCGEELGGSQILWSTACLSRSPRFGVTGLAGEGCRLCPFCLYRSALLSFRFQPCLAHHEGGERHVWV